MYICNLLLYDGLLLCCLDHCEQSPLTVILGSRAKFRELNGCDMKFQLKKKNTDSQKTSHKGPNERANDVNSKAHNILSSTKFSANSDSEDEDDFATQMMKKRRKVEQESAGADGKWEIEFEKETGEEAGTMATTKNDGPKYIDSILKAKKLRDQDEAENRQKLIERQIALDSSMLVFESRKYREQMLFGKTLVNSRATRDTYGKQARNHYAAEEPATHTQDSLIALLNEMIKSKVTDKQLQAYRERYFQRRT